MSFVKKQTDRYYYFCWSGTSSWLCEREFLSILYVYFFLSTFAYPHNKFLYDSLCVCVLCMPSLIPHIVLSIVLNDHHRLTRCLSLAHFFLVHSLVTLKYYILYLLFEKNHSISLYIELVLIFLISRALVSYFFLPSFFVCMENVYLSFVALK